MKQVYIILLLTILPLLCKAQSWNTISQSEEYISGIGNGSTVTEADRRVLADLVSKIVTLVSNNTNMGFKEKRIRTLVFMAQATLNNLHIIST